MDRIITSISDIENDSVKIMDDANAKKSEIFAQIQKETDEYDKEVEGRTNARIDELQKHLQKDMLNKLNQQQELAQKALHELTQHYEDNHSSYVERLFEEMTGV